MTQRDKILNLLVESGEQGVLNIQLNNIAFRYGARLAELREDGYSIRSSHIKGAVWRFTLLPQDKQQPQTMQVAAEMDEPQYMDFAERLRSSACCSEPVIAGFCGGCGEHV